MDSNSREEASPSSDGTSESPEDWEAALSQLEALELLGQVCGRIGHDINNLIGSVQGCAEIMERRLTREGLVEPHQRQLKVIHSAIKKITRMTRQLRSWARVGPVQAQEVELRDFLSGVEGQLREYEANFDIVQVNVPPETKFAVQPVAVEQMVVNLALDALDAVRGVERVLVLQVDERMAVDGERYLDLVISDNGRGMPGQVVEELFNPLAASLNRVKSNDPAFGLSLPMAWAVMHKHGGSVEVRSLEDVGTAVRLTFPRQAPAGAGTSHDR